MYSGITVLWRPAVPDPLGWGTHGHDLKELRTHPSVDDKQDSNFSTPQAIPRRSSLRRGSRTAARQLAKRSKYAH
jgi:hypothetical protein